MKRFIFIIIVFLIIPFLEFGLYTNQYEGFKGKCEMEKGRENEELEQWREDIIKKRRDNDAYFKTADTSPLAGEIRLTVQPDGKYFIQKTKMGFIFLKDRNDNSYFSVEHRDNQWIFNDAKAGVECYDKDKSKIKKGEKLTYMAKIKFDKYTVMVYPLKKYLVATVFNPDTEIIKNFKGLKYFPVNEKYRFETILEKYENPKKIIMLTSRNLEKTFYRYAKVRFKIDGKTFQLSVYTSKLKDIEYLFIPFTDLTTGKESYYSGRYLELPYSKGKSIKLDFNEAFNPLCNYSPAYNCAIPPAENSLKIRIEAGEKTYPHKAH